MKTDPVFRWVFVAVLVSSLGISATYRSRARRSGETIARRREGGLWMVLRAVFALPLWMSCLAYMLNPRWMAWASVPLPPWLRWLGSVLSLACVPLIYWVFRTIGHNISETVLTKAAHKLVTGGPYRRVRHPLYAFSLLMFLALSLVAANWFIALFCVLSAGMIALVVVPEEERNLLVQFGDEYRAYQARTGALLPRLWSAR
jgi:protein-S-isoprenylcysteine O-methyltransferase Ste14